MRAWSLRSRLVLGVVLLTTMGFVISGIVAQQALRSYLVSQVDDELLALSGGTLPRIAESGIIDEESREEFFEERGRRPGQEAERRSAPLSRIPTSTSVSLLDPAGRVISEIGGDLNIAPIGGYLEGLDLEEVLEHQGEAFTVEGKQEDFRAVAVALPDLSGSVVAARSLGDLNNTIKQLGFLFLLIGVSLITLIAIFSRYVIKFGMKPLADVEVTADQIASGDFAARMPEADPHTEVGRLVSALNSMLGRIESSFAARTESENKLRRFVADASHELRTPLTAIRGFSELYRQGAVTGEEATKELIGRIEGESMRMGSLVEDLLLLARLDQAREMESKPVDLVEVLNSAVASARAAGPQHPITFNHELDELFTLGDEARIHQVVANLLANARAHTPAGTEIDLLLSNDEDGIRIAVSDNGPGLSEDDQKRIFERFYRADSSRVRNVKSMEGEGSGLGLSIVDAVMKAHGGSVSVTSELGKGATFTLFFPIPS